MISAPRANRVRSLWRPLRVRIFRDLLVADLVSDMGAFLQSVGAAWLMGSLSAGPMYVALIQTASALPFFVLALPAGAIGDIVDRRRLILFTEVWMLAVSVVLAVTTVAGVTTPGLLLVLTFALSAGDAVEAPTWRAILPELVERDDLQTALALNGIEFNLARAVGPGLAGILIATAGVGTAFALNALSFVGVIVVIARWTRPRRTSSLPAETVTGATIAAVRYVRYSPSIRTVIVRSGWVMFFTSALWALLPTIAREVSGSSVAYGLLLGSFGSGAVLGAVLIQQVRSRLSTEAVLSAGTIGLGLVLVALAVVRVLGVLCMVLVCGGAAWTIFMSLLSTLVQNLAPDWVRARVLAVHLFVFQGSIAAGSAVWGAVAERRDLRTALLIAGVGSAASALLRFYARLPDTDVDLRVWNHWGAAVTRSEHGSHEGPVLVTIGYRIDSQHAQAFVEAMRQYERIRRRDGAVRWGIFVDAEEPDRYLETFLVHSWGEHLRQHARFTAADRSVEERVRRYARETPTVTHFIRPTTRSVSE
jgi:MFS family permease